AEHIARSLITRGPTPPLGATRAAELFDSTARQCHCLDGVSFYYQLTFGDSAIEASPSEMATPSNLRRIRDTVIANAMAIRRDPPPPQTGTARGVPITPLFLVAIFSRLDGRPYVFLQTVAYDTSNKPA